MRALGMDRGTALLAAGTLATMLGLPLDYLLLRFQTGILVGSEIVSLALPVELSGTALLCWGAALIKGRRFALFMGVVLALGFVWETLDQAPVQAFLHVLGM